MEFYQWLTLRELNNILFVFLVLKGNLPSKVTEKLVLY